jgi:hypothetical protein
MGQMRAMSINQHVPMMQANMATVPPGSSRSPIAPVQYVYATHGHQQPVLMMPQSVTGMDPGGPYAAAQGYARPANVIYTTGAPGG